MSWCASGIWRRLVLPITYFIEKPFQNWTRTSADIIGTVFLYVDYNVPLGALRAEMQRILDDSPLWDRKVASLQVTDTKQHTIEMRGVGERARCREGMGSALRSAREADHFLQRAPSRKPAAPSHYIRKRGLRRRDGELFVQTVSNTEARKSSPSTLERHPDLQAAMAAPPVELRPVDLERRGILDFVS